jgi:hypothetical protein
MKKWNDVLARTSSDIKLNYEISNVEVAGKKGLLMMSDVAAVAGDDDSPDFQAILKAMIGEDGKTRAYLLPTDDKTVLMSMGDEAHATKAIEQLGKSKAGLAQSKLVQAATKQLDPRAPWVAVVSPKGCVAWVKRIYEKIVARFGGIGETIPEFPDTPPLAISVKLGGERVTTEFVWPVETTQGLVAYLKKVSQER